MSVNVPMFQASVVLPIYFVVYLMAFSKSVINVRQILLCTTYFILEAIVLCYRVAYLFEYTPGQDVSCSKQEPDSDYCFLPDWYCDAPVSESTSDNTKDNDIADKD